MGIYIPNMDKPERCMYCIAFTLQEAPTHYAYDEPPYVYPYCELLEREIDDDMIPTDCPIIEIDEDEMEYLYKEFGLEEDENLTERAKELKRAILMGYLYAKSKQLKGR